MHDLVLTLHPAFYYTFKFVLILWMALPQLGGAQIIFRSFLQPFFARYFQGPVSNTASNLKNQAQSATSNINSKTL